MAFDAVVDRQKLEGAMKSTADAIREKTKRTDAILWDDEKGFQDAIRGMEEDSIIEHAEIPEYVKNGVVRIANLVNSVKKDSSIVFIATSDNHHYGDQEQVDEPPDANGVQTNIGNLHAAMAAKSLAHVLDVDFVADLGDFAWGSQKTTPGLLRSQILGIGRLLSDSHKGIPCFHAIGNHDTGIYYHKAMTDAGNDGVYTESAEFLYENFTALSESENTVFGGIENGGYCYRDFPKKRLRVFLLNTSEALIVNQTDNATLGSQRKWFADALIDLNNKIDAAEWKFVVLSHYPADYGNTMPLSELIKAYVEGSSVSISIENGTTGNANFAGKNAAQMIAQFHGHTHNLLTSRLYSYSSGRGLQYNAWRVCIPNGQYNRENYYSTVGNYADIDFSEDETYTKTSGTEKDTSFVVNVIDPIEKKIYSFCYGAGRDRVIGYGSTAYYAVSTHLTNVSISGGSVSIADGEPYSATLSIAEGYEWRSVVVTMGGTDITSSAYSNGKINIASVTGNVVITATAVKKVLYVNQIPISTDENGNPISDTGYLTNTYLSSSTGLETYNWDSECTGFIPCKVGDIVRLKNMSFSNTTNSGSNRLAFYNSSKEFVKMYNAGATYDPQAVVDENGNWTQFEVPSAATGAAYFRMTCIEITKSSIITVNQEIVD